MIRLDDRTVLVLGKHVTPYPTRRRSAEDLQFLNGQTIPVEPAASVQLLNGEVAAP